MTHSQNPKKLSYYGYERKDINKLIQDKDAAGLRGWFAAGVPLDVDIEQNPLLHDLIQRHAHVLATEMLLAGANPDICNDWCKSPPIKRAVENADLEGTRLLVWGGADPTYVHESYGSLLYTCAKSSGTHAVDVAERLIAVGAPLDTQVGQFTAEQKARSKNHVIARRMRAYLDLESAIDDGTLTMASMNANWQDRFQTGITPPPPMRWIDMNAGWAWMDRILPVLESKGETISRYEVLRRPENVAWATLGGALDAVDEHLIGQDGNGLSLDVFVKPDGSATQTLALIAEEWAEKKLLESQWMQMQPVQSLRRVLDALPEAAQDRVRNRHQMLANHQRQHKPVLELAGAAR